jgi:hypothetical protein
VRIPSLAVACLLVPTTVRAEDPPKPPAPAGLALGSCTKELDARKISYRHVRRDGIANGVEITGPIGGVAMSSPDMSLVIDCSLAISLDEAGRYLRALGIEKVTFSSAYAQRKVRGTNRPSKHSYGLALDVHTFSGPEIGTLTIDRDYEQGLGSEVDCLGKPLTQGGAVLKVLQCQLVRSGLFHLVLSPDFDDAHHDHFHLEATPWGLRTRLYAMTPAIH